jgi:hypothetical protein
VVCRVEKCQQLAIIQHCTSVLLTRSSTHWIGSAHILAPHRPQTDISRADSRRSPN